MQILKKIIWENKWSSVLILFAACASFVISYHIYDGSTWNITRPEELTMSMVLPIIISLMYLIFRMVKEGFTRSTNLTVSSNLDTEKSISWVSQLFNSLLISIVVFLFFLLISFPLTGLIGHLLFVVGFFKERWISQIGFFVNLILLLGIVVRWIQSVVLSVKSRNDKLTRNLALKKVFLFAVLMVLFSILQLIATAVSFPLSVFR